jgi:hypothetical protein
MQRTWTALVAMAITALAGSALAQGTLHIGMTASDIPLTTGQTAYRSGCRGGAQTAEDRPW